MGSRTLRRLRSSSWRFGVSLVMRTPLIGVLAGIVTTVTIVVIGFAPAPVYANSQAESVDESEPTESDRQAGQQSMETAKHSVPTSPPPPIGVRFGESLEGTRFRVAYSYERIAHQGLRDSDRNVSASDVLAQVGPPDYERTPRSLTTDVHTLELAYAPHPRVTLILELPFLRKRLDTTAETGVESHATTHGIGDVGFALIVPFIRKKHEQSQIHLGLDVPTGSVKRRSHGTQRAFDSQLGNGTVDLEWGLTYRGQFRRWSWGGQLQGHHPVGMNDLDYREGSRFEASAWGGIGLYRSLRASLRMDLQKQNNIRIHGTDNIDLLDDPSDNAKARGGLRLSISPGLTMEVPHTKHQRLAIEFGLPFYQKLDGPQLKRDWSVKAGWQWGF
ncbi:MAG: hypothetical protein ABGX04_08235 [Myxococcales bacterium]